MVPVEAVLVVAVVAVIVVQFLACGGRSCLCFEFGAYPRWCSCCAVGVLAEVFRFVGCVVECVPGRVVYLVLVVVVSLCVVGVVLLGCCRCGVSCGSEVSHSWRRCLFMGLWVNVLAQWLAKCCAIWLGSVANPSSPMSRAPMEHELPGVSFLRCVRMLFLRMAIL